MTLKTIFLVSIVAFAGVESCDTSTKDPKFTLLHDGLERIYFVHAPDDLPENEKVPLVFVLHGGGGIAEKMPAFLFNRFNDLADRDKFIVVYPQGIEKSWNDGRNVDGVNAQKHNIDDLGFFNKLIDNLIEEYPVDAKRVFSTGISNGGFMSFKLGCSLSEKIRAIAPVTAQIATANREICTGNGSVSLLLINGTDDPLVPYEGGNVTLFGKKRGEILSTDESIELWKNKLACRGTAVEKKLPDNNPDDGSLITSFTYNSCNGNNQIILFRVEGGGHTWPGGKQYLGEGLIGKTNRDINACDEIWNFFRQF